MLSPEEKLNSVLRELPPLDRAAALVVSLLDDECAPATALTLISVAVRMARQLPLAVRMRVIWHLLETAAEINASWN